MALPGRASARQAAGRRSQVARPRLAKGPPWASRLAERETSAVSLALCAHLVLQRTGGLKPCAEAGKTPYSNPPAGRGCGRASHRARA